MVTGDEDKIKDYGDSGITGGIAGSHGCRSVMYVQGREPATIAPDGIIRTMNAGMTWKFVGGPNNLNDKRFAVTGRGAVVIAFDDTGGVWRTTNGGDGTLSPSVLPFVTIARPSDTVRTPLCDSVIIPIVLGYSLCDSAHISGVAFLQDSLNQLSAPVYDNDFGFFSSSRSDTLNILYRPAEQQTWAARIELSIQQPDGYIEDTIIGIPLIAGPSRNSVLVFSGTTAPDTIDFDSVSICSDAFHTITLSNLGCGNLLWIPFDERISIFTRLEGSAVHFRPRKFANLSDSLYAGLCSENNGKFYIANSSGLDSIALFGTGLCCGPGGIVIGNRYHPCFGVRFGAFTIMLGNIACKTFVIDSIETNLPIRTGTFPPWIRLLPGVQAMVPFSFTPKRLDSIPGPSIS